MFRNFQQASIGTKSQLLSSSFSLLNFSIKNILLRIFWGNSPSSTPLRGNPAAIDLFRLEIRKTLIFQLAALYIGFLGNTTRASGCK